MTDHEELARLYEKELRSFSPFDLNILGIGKDGHTASLFPGDSALEEKKKWVVAIQAPEGVIPQKRITLTYPAINQSKEIIFLASEKEKGEVLNALFNDPEKARLLYPAGRVRPLEKIIWFIETAK